MTKFFKNKQRTKPVPLPEPRSTDEIKKEYGDLNYRLGDYTYQIKILKDAVLDTCNKLQSLAQENEQRKQLDVAQQKEEIK